LSLRRRESEVSPPPSPSSYVYFHFPLIQFYDSTFWNWNSLMECLCLGQFQPWKQVSVMKDWSLIQQLWTNNNNRFHLLASPSPFAFLPPSLANVTNNPNAIAIVLVNLKTAISVSNFAKEKIQL
jgi:hypothetical protein